MDEAWGAAGRGQVDVVVPTFDNRELVLQSVAALDDPAVDRIVVVDDVSSDDTVPALARDAPHVTTVPLDEHRGLSHALNAGMERGSAPYVLFMNDDVLAGPGAISRLTSQLESRPELTFAGGRLVDAGTLRTQREYNPRALPSTAGLVARIIGVERLWPRNPLTGEHLTKPLREDVPSIIALQPAGACLLVRRTAIEAIGGWDERFWFWYEDVDLVARLLRIGPGVWDPGALFRHVGRHSTRSWEKPKQHARLYHSTLRYAQSHCPAVGVRLVALVVLLACWLRVPFYSLRGRPAAAGIYGALGRQAAAVAFGADPGPPSPSASPRRVRQELSGNPGKS